MIARIWTGAVRREDADAYAEYMRETGIAGYAKTRGNRGVWMLRRDVDERTELVMLTLWDSLDAVKAFAGEDYETAVFYAEDERFLIERDLGATHFEVETYEGRQRRPGRRSAASGSSSGRSTWTTSSVWPQSSRNRKSFAGGDLPTKRS
jgi:heme-degrading monooxygenase HmoA